MAEELRKQKQGIRLSELVGNIPSGCKSFLNFTLSPAFPSHPGQMENVGEKKCMRTYVLGHGSTALSDSEEAEEKVSCA